MPTKFFALTLTFLLLLPQSSYLLAQNVPEQQGWETVQAFSSGTKLLVETKDGKQHKGKLNNVSATTLALTRTNGIASLERDNIQKIYQLSGGSRAKTALIGTAVGGGVGAGAAAGLLAATGGSDDFTGILGRGILIGAAIGAAIGLFAGKSAKRVLIYESR